MSWWSILGLIAWAAGAVVVFALAASLGGCQHVPLPEPAVRVVTVDRPVPVSCVPASLASAPDYPDADARLRAAASAADRYQLIVAGRYLRIARLGELEGVVGACRQ